MSFLDRTGLTDLGREAALFLQLTESCKTQRLQILLSWMGLKRLREMNRFLKSREEK
jgi:hypothetical protein